MFVKQPVNLDLGINKFLAQPHTWQTAFLEGNVTTFEDMPDIFLLFAKPHIGHLKELDAAPDHKLSSKPSFDESRVGLLALGSYPSFEVIESYIHELEKFFRYVLEEKGAENRVLRITNNHPQLCQTNQKTQETFGDALKLAKDIEVFTALKQGKILSFNQMIGRVFRTLANTLGVDYRLSEEFDQATQRRKAATFLYEGIGGFKFEDQGPDAPVLLTRYSHARGNYYVTFEGEATYPNLQRHVFNWLLDAMSEIKADDLRVGNDFENFEANRKNAIEHFYGNVKVHDNVRPTNGRTMLRVVS
jgi:hypothetical protein